ncbi:hypothetical protein EV182_006339, partial [Spiromyces aspiralis]
FAPSSWSASSIPQPHDDDDDDDLPTNIGDYSRKGKEPDTMFDPGTHISALDDGNDTQLSSILVPRSDSIVASESLRHRNSWEISEFDDQLFDDMPAVVTRDDSTHVYQLHHDQEHPAPSTMPLSNRRQLPASSTSATVATTYPSEDEIGALSRKDLPHMFNPMHADPEDADPDAPPIGFYS